MLASDGEVAAKSADTTDATTIDALTERMGAAVAVAAATRISRVGLKTGEAMAAPMEVGGEESAGSVGVADVAAAQT